MRTDSRLLTRTVISTSRETSGTATWNPLIREAASRCAGAREAILEYEGEETMNALKSKQLFSMMDDKFGHAFRDNWSLESPASRTWTRRGGTFRCACRRTGQPRLPIRNRTSPPRYVAPTITGRMTFAAVRRGGSSSLPWLPDRTLS